MPSHAALTLRDPPQAAPSLPAEPLLALLRRVAGAWRTEPARGQTVQRLALNAEERQTLAASDLLSSPAPVSARAHGYPSGTLGLLLAEETALAGLWRLREFDAGGTLRAERLEIAGAPLALAACAQPLGRPPNAPPVEAAAATLWREIVEARSDSANAQGRVFNLSLLPLSSEDRRALEAALGHGQVSASVESLHHCDIESTALEGVWRVRYLSSGRLVLDTLEIADLPEALCTPPDESAQALARLERWIAREAPGR